MSELTILGIHTPDDLNQHRELISSAKLILGGRRHLKMLPDVGAQLLEITPLTEAMEAIGKCFTTGSIVVLASGDPLFYGIAKKILGEFPEKNISIIPAVSSLQLACARFKLPWDDARIVSLHGRNLNNCALLLRSAKTLLLTDRNNSPTKIARELLDYLELIEEPTLAEDIVFYVAEDLGMETENIFHGSLQETALQKFSSLNVACLCIKRKNLCQHPAAASFTFGLVEEEIHHSRGLITKNEVRAATLHSLRLPGSGVFWDIGGGSGSVSIEAARLCPELAVYTIERHWEELANIKANIRTFGCYNITPVAGKAPEALTQLPDPDVVFIGGSGGNMEIIMEVIAARLTPGGRCVVNGVIEKTITSAPLLLRRYGFSVSTSEISVQRTDDAGNVKTFNPITIITGTR